MSTRKRPPILALLLDISGTLHIGSTQTPNAVEAFHRLQRSSIPFRLCSNTSKESTASLITRLDRMGFGVFENESEVGNKTSNGPIQRRVVWTSIGAVAQLSKEMGLKNPLLLLSDSAGQEVLDAIHEKQTQEGAPSDQPPTHDSVVIGLAPSRFDYSRLNTAFRILKGEVTTLADTSNSAAAAVTQDPDILSANQPSQIPLIATHKAKYVQTESGLLSLGPGIYQYILGSSAHVVGKPTRAFFHMVIQDFFTAGELDAAAFGPAADGNGDNLNARGRIAVIGDDVEADLGEGAVELGLWRVLVRTGKYRPGDENRPGVVRPDEVFDTFAEFVDSLFPDDKQIPATT